MEGYRNWYKLLRILCVVRETYLTLAYIKEGIY